MNLKNACFCVSNPSTLFIIILSSFGQLFVLIHPLVLTIAMVFYAFMCVCEGTFLTTTAVILSLMRLITISISSSYYHYVTGGHIL